MPKQISHTSQMGYICSSLHSYNLGLQRFKVIYDIMKIWRKRLTDSLNELINDKAVYRTAPATPGLLMTWSYLVIAKLNFSKILIWSEG